MYFHIFLLLNVYYITYPTLPSGILSQNVTGKRNLSIRNLHQTLLAGKVVNSKLGCSLHSTILDLGTILSLGNLLCSVRTILAVTHQIPEVNTFESQFDGTLLTDILNAVVFRIESHTGTYLVQTIGCTIQL